MEYKQPVDLKQTPSSKWDYHKARTFAQIELQQSPNTESVQQSKIH